MKTGESLRSLTVVAAVSLATLLVFMSGMFTAHVISAGGVMPAIAQMAQIVPGVYNVEQGADIPAATNLTPLKTFWRARQRIIDNYVYPEDIKEEALTYGAIEGMLSALGDPYSRFMDPEAYAEFQTESEGHFEGIGAELTMEKNPETGELEVVVANVLPEGPASKTALMAGTGARLAPWPDLAPVADVTPQQRYILVVDHINALCAEITDFLPTRKASSPAIVAHTPYSLPCI